MPFEQAWYVSTNPLSSSALKPHLELTHHKLTPPRKANLWIIEQSCGNHGWGRNNDANEISAIHNSILSESSRSGIPSEFILAVIIQESKGCVRAPTTSWDFANPGLMQSAGTASCAGITPCPSSTIAQMIHEGTAGEGLRTTLKNSLEYFERQGITDDSKWYKAARMYNAGPSMNAGNLGIGPTQCYASDIANRLIAPFGDSRCDSSVIASLTGTAGRTGGAGSNGNTPSTPAPSTPQVPSSESPSWEAPAAPVIEGSSGKCKKYYTPVAGDTCQSVPLGFAELRALNPQLNAECTNLWAGYAYCIAV